MTDNYTTTMSQTREFYMNRIIYFILSLLQLTYNVKALSDLRCLMLY